MLYHAMHSVREGRALEFEAVKAQCRQLSRRMSSRNVGIEFTEWEGSIRRQGITKCVTKKYGVHNINGLLNLHLAILFLMCLPVKNVAHSLRVM
jgi:hypothetical protein